MDIKTDVSTKLVIRECCEKMQLPISKMSMMNLNRF